MLRATSPKDRLMLNQVANVFVALMALLHVYILVLEMFLWATPRGRKAFGTTKEFAEQSKVLAASRPRARSCSSRPFRRRSRSASCCWPRTADIRFPHMELRNNEITHIE